MDCAPPEQPCDPIRSRITTLSPFYGKKPPISVNGAERRKGLFEGWNRGAVYRLEQSKQCSGGASDSGKRRKTDVLRGGHFENAVLR